MGKWHVFSEDHEIPGQLLVDFKNAVGAEEMMPFFERHGFGGKIDPAAWYPMQSLLDIYNEMEEKKGGTMFDFVAIGIKTAEQGIVPPEFSALPLSVILMAVEQVFKLNNRGTDPGETKVEMISDKHVKVTMRVPQPDDIWYGVFYGYVKRFAPPGTHYTVSYDDTVVRRDLGGETTVLHIRW